ncbi:MAG: DUF839 domain-containing protein [Actinobacteria bacterium]|nr:DUF839 domain-containing protein [Actinomycetota bacterium]
MRFRSIATAALTLGALSSGTGLALAAEGGDTQADYTPFERFTPLASSTPCTGEESGRQSEPFVIPPEYQQRVVAEEGDPGTNQNTDNWDMSTQNEFGKDAGRYVYRTHENRRGQASQVSLTDLKAGTTRILAERQDWEAFDGIVWTPQGTILAAEEVIAASAKDPSVPQANGGLVYELFVDRDNPSRLDPSRERITAGDGTTDTVKDGIRARPALGAKSHEGMRFDKRGFLYGIAESRGQTTAGQAGAIFRFIPDRKDDLSKGQLQALVTENRRTGEGRWVDLDRTAVQVDADAEAERKGANEYQRPEDVETGQSTGKDRNNGGNTVYVAITEGVEEGVLALDVSAKDRPFAYAYVGTFAGNNPGGFNNPDNLALDSKGNLAIAEDPPTNLVGADVFVAAPPQGGKRHQPARTVQRFSSLKDCLAEPSGVYFALKGTEKFSKEIGLEEVVNGETLFDHRQHAGQGSALDQLVAIAPKDDDKK